MNLQKLRGSIIVTLTTIIGLSTLFIAVILSWLGVDLLLIAVFIVLFNVGQWLIAPYILNAIYHIREISRSENPKLHEMVEQLSRKSGIKTPKLMLAQIPIPNAFAYGSPIAGNHVALTTGLLKNLEDDKVEAVIGHELGHLKHKDVQVMMFVSLLPALFYYIGYSMLWSSMWSRRDERGGSSLAALIGMICIAAYWVIQLFTWRLSRLREYYADRHSASIVEDGPRKLSEGLAKIVHTTRNMGRIRKETQHLNAFKALFIADPDHVAADSVAISTMTASSDQKLVQEILSQKLTTTDRIIEILSTHPNIIKRLKALQELS